MNAADRRLARLRAAGRCEYCRTRRDDEPARTYHIDHVVARQHGGSDDAGNLAWACPQCNRHKGPNLSGIDPLTGDIEPLFHPRRQVWAEHFEIHEGAIVGLTPTGRATVDVLAMNDESRVETRLMGCDEP